MVCSGARVVELDDGRERADQVAGGGVLETDRAAQQPRSRAAPAVAQRLVELGDLLALEREDVGRLGARLAAQHVPVAVGDECDVAAHQPPVAEQQRRPRRPRGTTCSRAARAASIPTARSARSGSRRRRSSAGGAGPRRAGPPVLVGTSMAPNTTDRPSYLDDRQCFTAIGHRRPRRGGGTLDLMITPGTTLENPVTGERFTFIETAASTDGERLTFELALRPGGAVPIPHVHPIQTERFEMLGGTMRFRVGLRHVTATAGDVVEIEPGVLHGFANAGDDEVRVRVDLHPALGMEEMFAEVVEMAEAGRMGRRGMPRNLLDLALLARDLRRRGARPVPRSPPPAHRPGAAGRPRAPARRTVTSAARDDDRPHDVTAAAGGEHGLDAQPARSSGAWAAAGRRAARAGRRGSGGRRRAGSLAPRPRSASSAGARRGGGSAGRRPGPAAAPGAARGPAAAQRRGARSGRAPRAAARGGPPAGARSACGRGRGACGPRTSSARGRAARGGGRRGPRR